MNLSQAESPRDDIQRFKSLTGHICDVLATEGVRARPWRSEELPFFSKLHEVNRASLLNFLEIYLSLISETSKTKMSIMNSSRRLTMLFLEAAGFSPTDDLAGFLKDGDFLAAYSRDQQMIFVSPNHFHYMSYSIEDLYCRPWMTMFKRNEMIEKVLLGRAFEFLTGKCTVTRSNLDIPPHTITEIDSDEKRSATCQSRLYSPLFRDGEMTAFISINYPLFAVSRMMPR